VGNYEGIKDLFGHMIECHATYRDILSITLMKLIQPIHMQAIIPTITILRTAIHNKPLRHEA
jgi:hypothetical protein